MKLVLLGVGGYRPNDRSHTLCMLVPECGVMLDAGTATYRAGRYLATPELDIFLTHAHLDHVIGLTYLLELMRAGSLRKITVHAAAEKLAAIDEHLFAEAIFPKKPRWELRPLAGEVSLAPIGGASSMSPRREGGRLRHFALDHPGGVMGFRLDWPGHSMAYVTDTTAAADAGYVAKIRGVDLLVHECYFPDAKAEWARRTGHSCTTPVAQVARRADVGRLLLVHLNPLATEDDPIGLDTARAIFPATELGQDWMEVEF